MRQGAGTDVCALVRCHSKLTGARIDLPSFLHIFVCFITLARLWWFSRKGGGLAPRLLAGDVVTPAPAPLALRVRPGLAAACGVYVGSRGSRGGVPAPPVYDDGNCGGDDDDAESESPPKKSKSTCQYPEPFLTALLLLLLLLRRHRRGRGRRPVIGDPGRCRAVLRLQRRVRRPGAPLRGHAEGGAEALAAGGVVGDGQERHAGDEEGEGPAAEGEAVAGRLLGGMQWNGWLKVERGEQDGTFLF